VFIPFVSSNVNFMFNQKISNKIVLASIRGGLVSLVAVLGLSESVMAQSSFEIANSSTSGGGGSSSGGAFAVVGTIGQAATGPIKGGAFSFLSGYLASECVIYAPSDLNFDGQTNAADLGVFLLSWGECPDGILGCPGDVNYDSHINSQDLGLVLINWE
jgi:hypothetical protein